MVKDRGQHADTARRRTPRTHDQTTKDEGSQHQSAGDEPGHRYSLGVILDDLEAVLVDRRSADPGESYTARLLADPEVIQRKIMEEAFEVCLELQRPDDGRVADEAADLLYHLLVGLVGAGVSVADVMAVLEERRT